jgi:hypothetical protein
MPRLQVAWHSAAVARQQANKNVRISVEAAGRGVAQVTGEARLNLGLVGAAARHGVDRRVQLFAAHVRGGIELGVLGQGVTEVWLGSHANLPGTKRPAQIAPAPAACTVPLGPDPKGGSDPRAAQYWCQCRVVKGSHALLVKTCNPAPSEVGIGVRTGGLSPVWASLPRDLAAGSPASPTVRKSPIPPGLDMSAGWSAARGCAAPRAGVC